MEQTLVIGGPGCGKTERLLKAMESAIKRGVEPERIAFVTFTKAAAQEAIQRASEKFGIAMKRLRYFRTLHSLCFYELGLKRVDVMSKEHLTQLSDITGETLTGILTEDNSPRFVGDLLITLDNLCRTTLRSLDTTHREADQEVDWFRLKRFVDALKVFKTDRGIIDFTDMLEIFVKRNLSVPVDVAIVDEGQDLSALQWKVVESAFRDAKELWVAGDDDQSVYKWSGADEEKFLSLPYKQEILGVSHRLPKAIFDFSQDIIRNVSKRYAKPVKTSRKGGKVEWVSHIDEVDFGTGTWLALARTRSQLNMLEEGLRRQGVTYAARGRSGVVQESVRAMQAHENLRKGWRIEGQDAARVLRAAGKSTKDVDENQTYTAQELNYDATPIWHDALIRIPLDEREYYLACRRRGERLDVPPRVRVDTIHGSKGAEADHVLLLTDFTQKVQKGFERDPDAEHKVFYVGSTRARETLTLVAPQSMYAYRM